MLAKPILVIYILISPDLWKYQLIKLANFYCMAFDKLANVATVDAIFAISSSTFLWSAWVLQRTILKRPNFFSPNPVVEKMVHPTLITWKLFSFTSVLTVSTFTFASCLIMRTIGVENIKEFGLYAREKLSFARAKPVKDDITSFPNHKISIT